MIPRCLVSGLALVAFAIPAFAQTPPAPPRPPTQIAPRPPATNGATAIGRAAAPANVPTISAAAAVQKANGWLNSVTTMVADFIQIGADGKRSEGKLYVQKPGKLRFEYRPPAVMEVVADGRSVAVRNRKLNTQDMAFIGQTPLKFLLKNQLDLSKDTKVLEVGTAPNATSILIEDKATFGGTSRINLIFDPASFQLKQWTVVDPQGFETIVSLFNLDLNEKPNPDLFKINEDRQRD